MVSNVNVQKKNNNYVLFFILLIVPSFACATIGDNRFIPFIPVLLKRPEVPNPYLSSYVIASPMVSTASESFNDQQEPIGLPEIFGPFNQGVLSRAAEKIGCPNPLRSDWQGLDAEISWLLSGKRQMQGITFAWNQGITDWLSFNVTWLFMRVISHHDYVLGKTNLILGPGDRLELDEDRRKLLTELGLIEGVTKQSGFGDIDWNLRAGYYWDHELKMRSITAGVSVGALIPTGVTREEGHPSSIPFGGDGHWGVYGALDGLFEIKEDMYLGLYFRVNKRFAHTRNRRMPVSTEPQIFGAICGPAKVDPGVTIIFSPYAILEHLRQGFGLGIYYTLTSHQQDKWCDERADQIVPTNLNLAEQTSKWGSDYVTVNVFYDFSNDWLGQPCAPIFSIRWDIPADFFITHRVNRTHKVSLGFEFAW